MKRRKVDEETNVETWMLSMMQLEMNPWWDDISNERDVSIEFDADFNFPLIQLMSHWVEQIRRYGAWQQYSAERQEQAHKTSLNDGWNSSHHNLNNLPHVITYQRRILCFEVRELKLQAHAQHRENSGAACKVLPSCADLAALLSPQLHAKPEFMGLQNRHDGQYPDGMIKAFRALLDNTQDKMHRLAI